MECEERRERDECGRREEPATRTADETLTVTLNRLASVEERFFRFGDLAS